MKSRNQDFVLDRAWIRDSFSRAAASYDAAAVLQREVADRLLERLDLIKLQPQTVVDLGAGTGYCSEALLQRYPRAEVIAVDMAEGMLRHARARQGWLTRLKKRQKFLCAEAEHLPLADHSVDMVFSSLTLQWCEDMDAVFAELQRVLKPGGLLMFATLGPDTLKELRAAWRAVDGHSHVSSFYDMHDVGDALIRARFADPVMDVEHIVVTYENVRTLMKDLKQIGSRNATAGRAHGLTGKRRLQRMMEAYEAFRREGLLPATYEVAYGHAWGGEATGQARQDGVVTVPLSQLKRSR